ncbi:MAG: SGNH/GDSL hydrolase family protein [Vicinamibacterales bacterium]
MPTPIVIVALGDSTTAGTPLYLSPLEAPPNGRGDERSQYAHWLMQTHPDWRVLNRGVNGERSDQIAARFDRDVVSARPAAVIAQLDAIYRHAAAQHIPVVAGSIVPYNTATPAQNQAMHAVNAWMAGDASKSAAMAFADTRRAAAAPGDLDRLAGSPDGLHPDIEGYRRMADAIEPVLAARLARLRPAPLRP